MRTRRSFLTLTTAWCASATSGLADTTWPLLVSRSHQPGPSRYVGRRGRSPWRIECLGDVLTGGSVALYHYAAGREEPIMAFADAVPPDARDIPGEFIIGRTARIERRPSWCPTASMLAGNPQLRCYGPGESENPMGQVAKFHIQGFGYRRLHSYTSSYWQTQGCFSVHDRQMEVLLQHLAQAEGSLGRAVSRGIDVLFAVS